jgi:predicted N-acetyltransferase YhbS
MEIRPAELKDAEDIVKVLIGAFRKEESKEGYKRELEKVLKSMEKDNWFVLIKDGNIIGTVKIEKHKLRIGKSLIIKGDVGDVAVLPEYQGKGYGSKLMENTVLWMRKEKYDLSRLGGLVKFYSRFGYIRFPRRYIEIIVGTKARAGADIMEEGEIPIDEKLKSKIRLFDPEKDFSSYVELVEKFEERYNGSLLREKPLKAKDIVGPLFFVFVEDGKVVGYFSGCRYEKDLGGPEGMLTIYNIGYEWERPYVLKALVSYINNLGYREGIKRITIRLPFDPEIIKTISETPVRFQVIETYGGTSGNMIQIINMKSLFERLIPELEERIKNSIASFKGILEIAIEKDSVKIGIDKGKIKVLKDGKPDVKIEIKEFYLIQLVLGLLSFSEIEELVDRGRKLKIEEKEVLRILFPRKPVFSGVWG